MDRNYSFNPVYSVAVAFFVVFTSAPLKCVAVYTNCGGYFEESKGVIHSPNFPNAFPVPIDCEWVIHAPRSKKTMIYFTQYYLSRHFDVYEYDYYDGKTTPYVGETKLATVDYRDQIWGVAGHKPYVVLRLRVQVLGEDDHMRVLDHFMDVYGFNITYEFADRQSDKDIKKVCYVHYCSYLGNCLASADFSEYKCHCFPGYFGEMCQYGPYCDPTNNINNCENNGKCRYFYGRFVNYCECPKGFSGTKCEISEGITSEICQNMTCEHECARNPDSGEYGCTCKEGYRLASDNTSCSFVERYRATVGIYPQESFWQLLADTTPSNYYEVIEAPIFQDLFYTMYDSGLTTWDQTKFGIDGYRQSRLGKQLILHFYCERHEIEPAKSIIKYLLNRRIIGGANLTNSFFTFTKDPELHIISITRQTNQDQQGILQGSDLSLSCAARGSPNMVFQWYKDGAIIDMSLSLRDAFQTIIPSATTEVVRSVLNIANVRPFDKGNFTCEARDYGEVKHISLMINVVIQPLVYLDPLSLSVIPGSNVTVRCLSPDDTQNTFEYEWFKDDFKILPGNPDRRVEHLKPTGTHLSLRNTKESANYTCRVKNAAGSVNVTSYIYVPKGNETDMFCKGSYDQDVLWRRTGGGHFFKERCPTETGDFSKFGPRDVGYATRRCECDKSTKVCAWQRPNFASCQSLILVKVYDKIEMLRLGYQHTNLLTIFDELFTFMWSRRGNLYSGDIEMTGGILLEILYHLKDFPDAPYNKGNPLVVSKMMQLLNVMITASFNASAEELQALQVGMTVLRSTNLLADGLLDLMVFDAPSIMTDNIEMSLFNSSLQAQSKSDYTEKSRQRRDVGTEGKDLAVSITKSERRNHLILKFIFPQLHVLLNEKLLPKSNPVEHSVSPLVSFLAYKPNGTLNLRANIMIEHDSKLVESYDQDYAKSCIAWKFHKRYHDRGRWTTDDCQLVSSTELLSVCNCRLPVHVMIVAAPYNYSTPKMEEQNPSHIFLAIGSGVLLVCCAILLAVYCKLWKEVQGISHFIDINIVISVSLLAVGFLLGITCKHYKVLATVVRALLYDLFLAALWLMLIYVLQHYSALKSKIFSAKWKVIVIAWGVPSAFALLFVIVSSLFLKDTQCHVVCWLHYGNTQFYFFIIPVILVLIGFISALIFTWKELLSKREKAIDWNEKQLALGHLCLVFQSFSVAGISLVCLSFDTSDTSHNSNLCVAFFILCLVLGISLLIEKCLLNNQISQLIKGFFKRKSQCDNSTKSTEVQNESNSFRAFVKSEKAQDCPIYLESKRANDYYDHVNRLKFTSERKRQLSSLLGSNTYEEHSPYGGVASDSGIDVGSVTDKTSTRTNASDGQRVPASVTVHFCDSSSEEETSMQTSAEVATPTSSQATREEVDRSGLVDVVTLQNKNNVVWNSHRPNGSYSYILEGDTSLNKMLGIVSTPTENCCVRSGGSKMNDNETTSLLPGKDHRACDDTDSHHSQEEDTFV